MNKKKDVNCGYKVFDEVDPLDEQQLGTARITHYFLISNSIGETIVYHTGS